MAEQNWSKEPWRTARPGTVVTDDDNMTLLVRGADDSWYEGNLVGESLSTENARRIVACVNACAGIPTEALEAGVIQELVAIVTRYTEYGDVFRYQYPDLNPWQQAKDVLAKLQQPDCIICGHRAYDRLATPRDPRARCAKCSNSTKYRETSNDKGS